MTLKNTQRAPYLIYDIKQAARKIEQNQQSVGKSRKRSLIFASITSFILAFTCIGIYYYTNYALIDEPTDAFVEHDQFILADEETSESSDLALNLNRNDKPVTNDSSVQTDIAQPKHTIKISKDSDYPRLISYRIIPGDTLSGIFKKLDVNTDDIPNILKLESGSYLSRISTGHLLKFEIDKNRQLTSLNYDVDLRTSISIKREGDTLTDIIKSEDITTVLVKVSGTIKRNLSVTAKEYNIPNSVLAVFSGIYRNSVNFKRDLRNGDRFALIYEHMKVGDLTYGYGDVMAAELNVRGKNRIAIRFEDKNKKISYLDPQGNPYGTGAGFLKHPITNPRITSKFGTRIHPVFKTRKKHNGTDYGAKRGTPIMATADGVVTHAGRRGSYGKTIVIDNGAGIKTLFAHMNGYAKGMQAGKRVNRGDIIGYVGSTGRSTGPHLHYEVLRNGVPRNSLTYELPIISNLSKAEKNKFLASANIWKKELESLQTRDIASSESINDIH